MLSPLRLVVQLVLIAIALPLSGRAQNLYVPLAQEYAIGGAIGGDQVYPDIAISEAGGYLVWQDGVVDGDGLGIGARRLNSSLSGVFSTFRINESIAQDQENPRVALMAEGGAVFVWQGGPVGDQDIYARFINANGVFQSGDILVNTSTNDHQAHPKVAVLADGSIIVVWTSFGGDMKDVFAQRLAATGEKLGGEFRINHRTDQNQRSPAVAALEDGSFAVAWIWEYVSNPWVNQFSTKNPLIAAAPIYCRTFDASGIPLSGDTLVCVSTNWICSNPTMDGLPGGNFTVVWSQRDAEVPDNSWDILSRAFTSAGVPNGLPARINTFTFGDQYAPQLASLNADQMVVWTSLGQDGSREGVFARFLNHHLPNGEELLVNQNNQVSRQIHPVVAADQVGRFLTVWSSFAGITNGYELRAQRFIATDVTNQPPDAPYVFALSSYQLGVSWPELAGFFNLAYYELFLDDNPLPVPVQHNYYVANGLAPGSTHRFSLAYRFEDGTRSPISSTTKAATWYADNNFDGLPDDWQQMYWGANAIQWVSPHIDSDGDGANNLREFLSGTNPMDPASILRTRLIKTAQGGQISWNTEPGFIYQVQKSVNFEGWLDYGSRRFAAGTTDSVPVGGIDGTEFYRVIRVR